nr:P5-2 [Southern rice black-streaked dwarf virus]
MSMTRCPIVSPRSRTGCSHQKKCACLIISDHLEKWELTIATVNCHMISRQEKSCTTIIPVRFDLEISDILSLENILDAKYVATITELALNFPCVNWDIKKQQLKQFDPTQSLVKLEQNFNQLQRDDKLHFNCCYNYPALHILNRILNVSKDVIPFLFDHNHNANNKTMFDLSSTLNNCRDMKVSERHNLLRTLLFGSTLGVILHV